MSIAFGISSYAYPWAIGVTGHSPPAPMTAEQLLREAQQLGAHRLQLADNLPVHQLATEAWNNLIRGAQQANVQLELGLRGLRPDQLCTYLTLAQQCRSPFVRVVIDAASYEPQHDEIVRVIREVLPAYRQAGVRLAIENHDRFRAYELVDIIEATDADYVGICLDTANSLGADEGIWEVARTLAPHTLNLHVKDYRIERVDHQMGFIVRGAPAGSGQTPVGWLLETLRAHGRCQSATLEVWSAPLAAIEETVAQERRWVKQGSTYLRHALSSNSIISPPP